MSLMFQAKQTTGAIIRSGGFVTTDAGELAYRACSGAVLYNVIIQPPLRYEQHAHQCHREYGSGEW